MTGSLGSHISNPQGCQRVPSDLKAVKTIFWNPHSFILHATTILMLSVNVHCTHVQNSWLCTTIEQVIF